MCDVCVSVFECTTVSLLTHTRPLCSHACRVVCLTGSSPLWQLDSVFSTTLVFPGRLCESADIVAVLTKDTRVHAVNDADSADDDRSVSGSSHSVFPVTGRESEENSVMELETPFSSSEPHTQYCCRWSRKDRAFSALTRMEREGSVGYVRL